MPPVRTLLLGLQHLLVWPGPGCAAEQLGSAGGWSRRPREELLGRGQAPGWGHQEPHMAPARSRSSSARASPSELKALGQMAEKWVNLAKFALFQRQG